MAEASLDIAVIPARFGSSRFPGKPLADRTGKPLVQHVYERAQAATRIGRVLVATDDRRIFDAVRTFGGEAVMTRPDHPNGTMRIAEAIESLYPQPAATHGLGGSRAVEPGVVVNVQGDEPEIEPGLIDDLVQAMHLDADAIMATVASPFTSAEDPADPNIVKVAVDRRGRALLFTRAAIPYQRVSGHASPLKHVGIYAYRRPFLRRYVELTPTPLEQAESLEQLRVLEHGFPIAVIVRDVRHTGIDTPEQYEAFASRQAGG